MISRHHHYHYYYNYHCYCHYCSALDVMPMRRCDMVDFRNTKKPLATDDIIPERRDGTCAVSGIKPLLSRVEGVGPLIIAYNC